MTVMNIKKLAMLLKFYLSLSITKCYKLIALSIRLRGDVQFVNSRTATFAEYLPEAD